MLHGCIRRRAILFIFISALTGQPGFSQTIDSAQAKKAWWRQAKFGLFIHWGLYAIPADGEWHMRNKKESIAVYSQNAAMFNPVKFNADEWAAIAQEAGVKYMVITTKHHDGFAMFHSKASAYNIVDATPFKRDVIKELAGATPKHDIRFGTYYSMMADWGHPGGGKGEPNWDSAQNGDLNTYFNTVAAPQLRELMTNYGPLAELWLDTDGARPPSPEQTAEIYKIIHLQPQLIVNTRVVKGDFNNAERHMPALTPLADWEYCDIISPGSWGYNKKAKAFPLPVLIRQLIDVVSRGGNELLNVGPRADGTFPEDAVDRLKGMGAWLKINGDAVYGTTAGPFDYLPWGRSTIKENKLYLHVFDWPADGKLNVPMANKVSSAWLLSDKTKKQLKFKTSNGSLTLSLPSSAPDSIASVIVLDVKDPVAPVHSLALDRPAEASVGEAKYAFDNNPDSGWENPNAAPAWIKVDLGTTNEMNTMRLSYTFGKIIKFSMEYWDKDHWQTVFEDENLPIDRYVKTFSSIKAQLVRFNIKEASGQKNRIHSLELFDAN